MRYTDAERENAAIQACSEWLKTRWGQEYLDLTTYLPKDKAEEVRLMLQRSIRQAMSHRPNELVSVAEINRQYCNLLDSQRLDTYENLAGVFRNAAIAAEEAQTEAERQKDHTDAIQRKLDDEETFRQSIIDRQKQDAANKQVDIKELRRRALFSERVNGRIQTTPMPASIKVVSRTARPTAAE